MIEIKLTGDNALLFLQNEANSSDNLVDLQSKYRNLSEAYNKLQEDYNKLVNTKVSSKVLKDSEILDSMNSNPFTKQHKEDREIVNIPTKLKSRLSKKDREDLDVLATGKFRSSAKLSQFASQRNLRESTVETYINKHSDDKYKLVHGSEIKPYQVWENGSIDPTAMYITMR
jgi:hypothetical protein